MFIVRLGWPTVYSLFITHRTIEILPLDLRGIASVSVLGPETLSGTSWAETPSETPSETTRQKLRQRLLVRNSLTSDKPFAISGVQYLRQALRSKGCLSSLSLWTKLPLPHYISQQLQPYLPLVSIPTSMSPQS